MRRLTLAAFWGAALAWAAVQLYGDVGAIAAGVIAAFWFLTRAVSNAWVRGIGVALPLLWTFWLVPSVERNVEDSREKWCQNQIRQCVLAVGNYEAAYRRYPPARTGGRSWRVTVFPYFCLPKPDYRFEEPWDSPHNWEKVSSVKHAWFRCPGTHSENELFTTYHAVVDDRTIWPPDRQITSDEITDNPSSTIAIIEAPDYPTYWAKPDDLSFDEAVRLLSTVPRDEVIVHGQRDSVFRRPFSVINVAFVDSKTRSLRWPLKREMAVALLTRAGGETIDLNHIDDGIVAEFDGKRAASIATFLVLAVAPACFKRL